DLRLRPVRVDEVAHEPPEGLVVVALVGGVDALWTVEALGKRTGKFSLLGLRKAAVLTPGPLHRGAYGESSWDVEVFGHSNLLAVEEDRSPRQGEGERIGHPHSPLIAAEHRGEPPAQSAPVELHVRLGAEGVENLLAFIVFQLVEGELIVVAHEVSPLARQVQCRSLSKRLRDWAGIAAHEREIHGLHPD